VDSELEVIHDEMEQTRASLADKLGALETQVRETVSGATDAVSSTVEGVKEVVSTVSDTVDTVKEQFSISKQFDEHPWLAMGVAVGAGFVAAQLFDRARAAVPGAVAAAARSLGESLPLERPAAEGAPKSAAESKQEGDGVLHSLGSLMPGVGDVAGAAVSQLGGLAVGSLMGLIREMVANHLPQEWKGEVNKFVEQVADKLGGKPLDPTRSNQLLSALGLCGKEGECGGEQRQEGAPATGRFPAR
jgi:ElaB/YqjD/DUF883 family membrane-anchored ribosome-binding protein